MRSSIRWIVLIAAGASLACLGEAVLPLTGAPCITDLDCPTGHACLTTQSTGERSCEPFTPFQLVDGTNPDGGTTGGGGGGGGGGTQTTPYFCKEVKPILDTYCNACHGTNRVASGIDTIRFDMYQDDEEGRRGAYASAVRIKARMVDFKDMPSASSPQPSDEQRAIVGRWVNAGAPYCDDGSTPGGGTTTPEQDAGTTTPEQDAGTTTPPPDAGTPVTPVSYSQQIQPIWNMHCTGCHMPGTTRGQLNLAAGASYAEMVNVASVANSAVRIVQPGSAANSMLWRKVAGAPNRSLGVMPTSGALITFDAASVTLIERWINEGAQNN